MTGKLLLAILLLCTASFFLINTNKVDESNTAVLFKQWQQTHNKVYENSAVAEYRFAVFQQNVEIIAQQNAQNNGVEYGVNQFSDMTNEEFVFTFLGYKSKANTQEPAQMKVTDVPNDVDWRQKGAVTAVKDQGKCGSCWAFSTTGDLEGLYFIKKATLVPLSEQQLMDCSYRYGNMGCNGGLMDNAFDFVKDHGICTEKDVPYKAKVGKCAACPVLFKVTGFTRVPHTNEGLQAAIVIQPTSVAVDASNWQNYKTGVFKNCDVNLNHGVLAVGYTADAWIVKNSWSSAWGEQGYIRLAIGNTCGILNEASYAQM